MNHINKDFLQPLSASPTLISNTKSVVPMERSFLFVSHDLSCLDGIMTIVLLKFGYLQLLFELMILFGYLTLKLL